MVLLKIHSLHSYIQEYYLDYNHNNHKCINSLHFFGTGAETVGVREGEERGVLLGGRDGGVHLDHGQGAQGPAEGRDGGWGAGEAGF